MRLLFSVKSKLTKTFSPSDKIDAFLIELGMFCFSFLFVETKAQAQTLFVTPQAMSQFLRLSPTTIEPKQETERLFELQFGKTWSNYWANDKRFFLDGQTTEDRLQVGWNIYHSFRLQMEYIRKSLSGLAMDDVAIGFHRGFGIPQDKRLDYSKNRNQFSIPDHGLDLNTVDRDRALAEQLALTSIFRKRWQGFDVGLAMTVAEEVSRQGLRDKTQKDFLWQTALGKSFGLHYATANFNWLYSDTLSDRLYLNNHQRSLRLVYSYALASNLWANLEAFISESPFVDIGQLSKNSYEIYSGVVWNYENYVFQAALIENILWPFNSPDWGFMLSIGSYWISDQSRQKF